MAPTVATLTIRFSTVNAGAYRVDLEGLDVGERHGPFTLPYTGATWQAVMQALEPGFVLAEADKTTQAALKPLGDLPSLPRTAGAALANALLADDGVRLGFDVALGRAEAVRRSLPVEMRFGAGCDALAALPWELFHYRDRFLLADTSIALSRYPEGAIPPTPALGELPLRVLLVLSEPVGASPIFPERAREELLHGLRTLDEAGAVVVDLLRPPTFSTLVEAVTNGGYHMLVFYGHGGYDPDSGGLLLFEDEFDGPALIKASELGSALRNTAVRLVLLGACQSATVADPSGFENPKGLGIWSGTAPALVRAGVPLAIGMQVSMRVDAAQAFIRQFALSLAAGKPVTEAVGDARKPIIRGAYGEMWYAPALYGRPAGDYRLFDPKCELPANTADLRAEMKAARAEIERLKKAISGVGVLEHPVEIFHLRKERVRFAQARAEVGRRTSGGYAAVVSPLYRVPTNPIFVGRTQELHDVAQAFVSGHPVVIWGAGGIGKSALAAEVAHRQSWRFPGGVLWLDCRGGPAIDTLLNQIGAFAGIEAIDKVEPNKKETTVKWALAGLDARCLLVWDNTEEVWEDRSLRRYVENLPANCQALLTTRENPEQAMWPTVELAPLSGQAMHDLFYRLASAAGVKAGGQADLDAIPLILDWLQGHPLALSLVVPLAMKRGLQRVWADLQAHPLKGIEAAFEVSYERLTDLQRRVFTRLSVYKIPFDWPAAQALLPGEAGVDDALDVLVQRALMEFDGARYSYHALLRQYAYARQTSLEDVWTVHRLAADYLHTKLSDPTNRGTPDEMLEEVDQWERAEAWESFVQCAHSLVDNLGRLGHWPEIDARLQRAITVAETALADCPDREAELLNDRATIAFRSARWLQAISLANGAAAAYERTSNDHGRARTYNILGAIYLRKGEWDRAIAFFEKSLTISERVSDFHSLADALGNLSTVYACKGEWDWVIASFQQVLAIDELVGDIYGMSAAYANLGLAHSHKGEWDRAIAFLEKSQAIDERAGYSSGMASTYNNLGTVYTNKGVWDRAIAFFEKSLTISERVSDIYCMAQTYANLGVVYTHKGEWDRAIAFFEKSMAISERVGDLHGVAKGYNNLSLAHTRKGEWDRALAFCEQALAIMERLGDAHGMAVADANLAAFHAHKGEWDRAIAFCKQALAILERLGETYDMARAYGNLGRIVRIKENREEAADCLAHAYLLLADLGASETEHAASDLVSVLGSVEAANTYLARLAEGEKS